MTSHLDEHTLRLFTTARLDEEQETLVESHLKKCPECLKRLHDLELKEPGRLLKEIKSLRLDDSAASETIALDADEKRPENDDFIPGDLVGGNYRLEKQLGRGGMGIAWKAFDVTAQRPVVLKFVPKEIQHIPEAMSSVRESFQKVHALQHQHICPLYGLFDDPKHGFFLVMKFIDGLTLNELRKQYQEKTETISLDKTIQILAAIADGLDYAHRQKVVHRDIKPQNIVISPKDGVQIIDFGLADEIRETLSRSENIGVKRISGTRSYMAPEQWEGKRQDAKTDQYALAVTAYELLAGHVPFSSNDTEILRNCVLHALPDPILGLPFHVNASLLKAMSKKREDRFGNCAVFVDALSNKSSKTKPNFKIHIALTLIVVSILILSVFFSMRSPSKPDVLENNIVANTNVDDLQESVAEKELDMETEPPVTINSIDDFLATSREPLEIPARKTDPVVKIIRMCLEIDADGKGRFFVKKGSSTDTLEGFPGTSFSTDLFSGAQTYHGENGMGRVFFDLRDTTWDRSWRGVGRMRSWSRFQIYSYGPGVGLQTKSGGLRIEMPTSVTTAISNRGYGVGLGKGRLPCRITVEVLDQEGKLPDIEMELVQVGKTEGLLKSSFIRGSAIVEANGKLRAGGSFTVPNEWDRVYHLDGVNLKGVDTDYFKEFQLPQSMVEDVNHVVQYLRIRKTQIGFDPRYESGDMAFEVISFDIWGRFGGNTGLIVAEQEGVPVVQAIEPYDERLPSKNEWNPANGLKVGDHIVRFNSEKLSATEIQRRLDKLNFGDLVKIEVLRDGQPMTFNFHAE